MRRHRERRLDGLRRMTLELHPRTGRCHRYRQAGCRRGHRWRSSDSSKNRAALVGRSRAGDAGPPAADPAVLVALWLYATVEGWVRARELERLAQSDAAFRWLAGGVPLNYHGLADFRVESVEVLDRLLTQSVMALIGEGLVKLVEIAVDGKKIRASARQAVAQDGRKIARGRGRSRHATTPVLRSRRRRRFVAAGRRESQFTKGNYGSLNAPASRATAGRVAPHDA